MPDKRPLPAEDAAGRVRLLRARAEIEALLKREGFGAFVLLHAPPGMLEIIQVIDPPYSCLRKVDDTRHGFQVHIRSCLADYDGDAARMSADRAATANFVHSVAHELARAALPWLRFSERIDDEFGAEHEPPRAV